MPGSTIVHKARSRLLILTLCVSLTLLFAPQRVAFPQPRGSPFSEATRTCQPECHLHGNCNGETGECDCPFGYQGPTCTESYLPACHSSNASGTEPHVGAFFPKNCECYWQLRNFSCSPELKAHLPEHEPHCILHQFNLPELFCYTYIYLPPEQQLSDYPALDDPRVTWHKLKFPDFHVTEKLAQDEMERIKDASGEPYMPLSACPERCSEHGFCRAKRSEPGHTLEPFCRCHGTWTGKTCSENMVGECYHNCSGIGTCVDGWCHCQPGYWGPGCTRNKAYNSSVGWLPNPAALRIYVYTLPAAIAHRIPLGDVWEWMEPMYSAELPLTEELLADVSVFTQNPWEANLFYVPGYVMWYYGNAGTPSIVLLRLSLWLRHHAPFWNMTGGRNHVWLIPGDRGACDVYDRALGIQKPIQLVHFGQAKRHPYSRVPFAEHYASAQQAAQANGCLQSVGDASSMMLPAHEEAHSVWRGSPYNQSNGDIIAETMPCYRPEKDIVIPPTGHPATFIAGRTRTYTYTKLPGGGVQAVRRNDSDPRNNTFFFAGHSTPDMSYSQGVRQTVVAMFSPGGRYDPDGPNSRPDFFVPLQGGVVQHEEMRRAKFCLAPSGFGWGIRLTEAIVCGCIPVIVQDHAYQPLWDVLPYHEFSLRIARRDLHRLVDILDAITPQQLEALQRGGDRWHRAFFWTYLGAEPGQSTAYTYTLEALRRRVASLNSEFYRHRHRQRIQRHRLLSLL